MRNAADGTPFEDVMILVDGERAAPTDAQGRFQLRDLPPGRHLISLVGPQGQDQHTEVELGPGVSLKRSFRLSAAAGGEHQPEADGRAPAPRGRRGDACRRRRWRRCRAPSAIRCG